MPCLRLHVILRGIFVRPHIEISNRSCLWAGIWWLAPFTPQRPGPVDIDDQAPLSKWRIIASFDTAERCENQLLFTHKQAEQDLSKAPPSITLQGLSYRDMLHSACIATDDPRLKGN